MTKDIFEIYDKARQNLVDANCNFISVKNSSPLGQGGRRFMTASNLFSKNYRILIKKREILVKKYPNLKKLFDEKDDLNISVKEIKDFLAL